MDRWSSQLSQPGARHYWSGLSIARKLIPCLDLHSDMMGWPARTKHGLGPARLGSGDSEEEEAGVDRDDAAVAGKANSKEGEVGVGAVTAGRGQC